MDGAQTILTPPPTLEDRPRGSISKPPTRSEGQKVFAFDRSYWSFDHNDSHFAGQDDVFEDLGKPLLENAFQGYNNCIFAYGQTGSGKSYSMMGYREAAGVIPRVCKDMFERIGLLQTDRNVRCTVEVSYLEIYNERVRDLLNPSTRGNLKVREHPSTGPYVEDLARLVVRSFQEIDILMDEGNKARTVAATNMNETSSRSHAVFTLTLTQHRHDVETSLNTEKVAKINLVDLAGSERATSTGATGARLKEGAEINRSLSTLGRVIAALADLSSGKRKNMSMVPYRDSVLTWLLKDSIGGNSLTAMIAAISPADINYEETLSTLRYADSAKRIKNHAVVNEDPNARMIRELKEELAQLRLKLSGAVEMAAGVDPEAADRLLLDTPLDQQMVSIVSLDGTVKKVSKADIAEQLSQSEKLYQDINQTWEQKLQRTEQIHKEREAALEELGISIEKGFVGLHTPKKMPHLVNLSDDPLLAECLVYNLKPGVTTVGNLATSTASEIRLDGNKILGEHCTFENTDGVVTVVPSEHAAIMVNGVRIDRPTRLRSGHRIILGDFHIFRFNNPQEARAERAERSLLRHSIAVSRLSSPGPSRPSPRSGHRSTPSPEHGSDLERQASTTPQPRFGHDSDWLLARREAAHAIFGPDPKVAQLTDDELDMLFAEVDRVRAVRKGRPESKSDGDDDADSVTSFPVRENYTSVGTIDTFSVDTAITFPSTPQPAEGEERLRQVRDDVHEKLEKSQERLPIIEAADNDEIRKICAESGKLEESLRLAKEELRNQSDRSRKRSDGDQNGHRGSEHKHEVTKEDAEASRNRGLALMRSTVQRWRQQRYVHLAEVILQHGRMLKEAQVMSQSLGQGLDFQFVMVEEGHTLASSYDLVFNCVSGEEDDALEASAKPCVGIRVLDHQHSVIHLWSISTLQQRIKTMRQMHRYVDRPEYVRHLRLTDSSSEAPSHQYSRVGDADVPLTAVFERRVQDISMDVISPYTFNVVGIVRLSLEPSAAHAPPSTLKFNVVMHEFVGFAEREGTEVHAQLFVPGVAIESGATTTRLIKGFDESPVRFESVHGMSIPHDCTDPLTLRVSMFAKVTAMHMDKLLSWDGMANSSQQGTTAEKGKQRTRIAESEFYSQSRHDVFARLQVCEMSDVGEYVPVEVIQNNAMDAGVFQLHQGVQRRIVVRLAYHSAEARHWKEISSLRVGNIRLADSSGRVPDFSSPSPEVALKMSSEPQFVAHANGTSHVVAVGHWDSSLHESLLLNKTTAATHRIRMSLQWEVRSQQLARPMKFELDLDCQVRPRSYTRSTSRLMQLWNWSRVVHSTITLFSVVVRPSSAKRAADLWRMNSQVGYIRGQEHIKNWAPRGVSLVREFLKARKRRRRALEMEVAKGVVGRRLSWVENGQGQSHGHGHGHGHGRGHVVMEDGESWATTGRTEATSTSTTGWPDPDAGDRQQWLMSRYVHLWSSIQPRSKHPAEIILDVDNTEPPSNGISFVSSSSSLSPPRSSAPRLVADVQRIIKK